MTASSPENFLPAIIQRPVCMKRDLDRLTFFFLFKSQGFFFYFFFCPGDDIPTGAAMFG